MARDLTCTTVLPITPARCRCRPHGIRRGDALVPQMHYEAVGRVIQIMTMIHPNPGLSARNVTSYVSPGATLSVSVHHGLPLAAVPFLLRRARDGHAGASDGAPCSVHERHPNGVTLGDHEHRHPRDDLAVDRPLVAGLALQEAVGDMPVPLIASQPNGGPRIASAVSHPAVAGLGNNTPSMTAKNAAPAAAAVAMTTAVPALARTPSGDRIATSSAPAAGMASSGSW